ncbi:Endo-1,4-beta-xylanase D [Lachnellula hyalina]|uniref:Endo-1,4-beta-xylanase D n=1 Tax=Lachnellula hyalina TaxID=1316788 RepID=A0A8H8QY72_9HELO|nr:Endo-1,4-beta-xylanase D [Lachnellula hyalina]TVY24914.1 Endo-1,4-beta-xylanase D [Lachnellula hyalina]
MLSVSLSLLALSSATVVYAQAAGYAQCGGVSWQGATTCAAGYTCTVSSEYYSQCLPGSDSASTTTLGTGSATPTSSSGSSPTNGPGTTLQTGYYWIRAVEDPNFHKYLQTSPEYTPGTALLADYTTAGQFQIVDGQLVELITGGLLYAVVEPQANSTVSKLSLSFGTEMNTYGTFAFSGDAVQWSIPSISRPNLSAWLVCENQTLWINLGAYAYMTPAGCADETIHYYNGATAVS